MAVHVSRQPDSATVLIWNDDAEHIRLTDAEAAILLVALRVLVPECPRETCFVPATACILGFDVDRCPKYTAAAVALTEETTDG